MSKMIPRRSIDAFRRQVDVTLDAYGFSCDLYIPTNLDDLVGLGMYVDPTDIEYTHYTAPVFIHWAVSIYALKKLGVYVEGEQAVLVNLPNNAVDDDGAEVAVNVLAQSYIRVPLEFIPGSTIKNAEFELVCPIIKNIHDAALVRQWKAVPRRVPEAEITEDT